MTFLYIALGAWFMWCACHLACMALIVPDAPAHTGFRIVIPARLYTQLERDELFALIAHEMGHQAHAHCWKNLLRICFFAPPSIQELRVQEYQADAYVANMGLARPMASALRKLSNVQFDHDRAIVLDSRAEFDAKLYAQRGDVP